MLESATENMDGIIRNGSVFVVVTMCLTHWNRTCCSNHSDTFRAITLFDSVW